MKLFNSTILILFVNSTLGLSQMNCKTLIKKDLYFFKDGNTYLSIVQNSQNSEKRKYPRGEPGLSIITGTVFGFFLGSALGLIVAEETSSDSWKNGIRGAILGMSIFPFINYELMTMRAGIRNGKNRWKISLGTDVTFTNHKRTDNHFGKYFTISRHYYLDDQGELIGSINYAQRKFALTNQKISYSTSVTSEMQYYNINFDVSYIDVLLLPSVHNRDSNLKITVGIGPLISIQILERTEYNLIKVDTLTNKLNDQDFRFITDEPPFPFPYLGFCGAVDLEYRSVLIQLKFESSISKSNQIEFLNDETRLSTIKIAVGYCFN